jgi:hypothetical protein
MGRDDSPSPVVESGVQVVKDIANDATQVREGPTELDPIEVLRSVHVFISLKWIACRVDERLQGVVDRLQVVLRPSYLGSTCLDGFIHEALPWEDDARRTERHGRANAVDTNGSQDPGAEAERRVP